MPEMKSFLSGKKPGMQDSWEQPAGVLQQLTEISQTVQELYSISMDSLFLALRRPLLRP